jgi:hypothetical protein
MLRIIQKKTFALVLANLFVFLPGHVLAQGLTIIPTETPPIVGSIDYIVLGLIVLRFILVGTIVFAGAIAIFQAYLWMTHEGNMVKAYEAKETLGRMVIIITASFIALSVYRFFIEDYALLQF